MLHLAQVFQKASPWSVLTKIRFPCALPSLFAGMKVAISFALVGAIVGEFVAGSRGIGFQILVAQGQFDTVRVFVSLLLLGLVGTILVLSRGLRRTPDIALARLATRAPRTIGRARTRRAAEIVARHAGADRHGGVVGQQSCCRAIGTRDGPAAGTGVLALGARGDHSHHHRLAGAAAGLARRSRAQLGGQILGGVVGVGLFSYCLLWGAYQSLAIEVGFINATTPVWVLLLGRWMGEAPLSAKTKWGVALAFAGTLLIITKGKLETLTQFQLSLGNLWSLIAAIAFAWFSIRVRDWSRTIASPLPLMVVTGWAGLLGVMTPAYLIWVAFGGPWFVWNDADMGYALAAVSYMGLLPTMLGNLFYLYGVAVVGAARAAAFLRLSPLFSAGLSILWLGEQLAWYHLAGIAAIFAGLLISGKSGPARLRPEPV